MKLLAAAWDRDLRSGPRGSRVFRRRRTGCFARRIAGLFGDFIHPAFVGSLETEFIEAPCPCQGEFCRRPDYLTNQRDTVINDLNCSDNCDGIEIGFSNNIIINNSVFHNNGNGLYLVESDLISIFNCEFIDNYYGIEFYFKERIPPVY